MRTLMNGLRVRLNVVFHAVQRGTVPVGLVYIYNVKIQTFAQLPIQLQPVSDMGCRTSLASSVS